MATVLVSCSAISKSDGFTGVQDCSPSVTTDAQVADNSTPYICRAEYVLADEADSPATVLLSGIPNLPEYREIVRFDDFVAVARIHGIQRPARDSSNEVLSEYARSLVMADVVDPLKFYPVVSNGASIL